MSELPFLLTAAPSEYPSGASSLLGADFMPTPLIFKSAGKSDIAGIVNRGLEKNKDGNPSVKAARGIGGTASRVMFRDLADRVSLKYPDTSIGAQGENNSTATNMLDNLEKRVEAGKAGALAAPITSESLEMIDNYTAEAVSQYEQLQI